MSSKKEESVGFCMFYDWVEDLDYLEGESAWQVVKALYGYYRTGQNPVEAVERPLKAIVSLMFHQIKRKEAVSEGKSAAGKKGAAVINRLGNDKAEEDCAEAEESSAEAEESSAEAEGSSAEAVLRQRSATETNTNTNINTNTNTNTNTYTYTDTQTNPDTHTHSDGASRGAACVWDGGREEKEVQNQSNGPKEPNGFTRFWEAYPKKVGKGQVCSLFASLNPDGETVERMLDAIEAWKRSEQWNRKNGRYIPNPATWLTRRQWEDEPPQTMLERNFERDTERFFAESALSEEWTPKNAFGTERTYDVEEFFRLALERSEREWEELQQELREQAERQQAEQTLKEHP